ncbi:endonuclease domain-containing protein [Blastococcus sp. SYSU DS0616]
MLKPVLRQVLPALQGATPVAFPGLGDPLVRLVVLQGGACAATDCLRPLDESAKIGWDMDHTRIAGVYCHGCVRRRRPLGPPPVEQAPPLLRLQLTLGPPPRWDRAVTATDRRALRRKAFDVFRNALDALWVEQGGCALDDPELNPHSATVPRMIYPDHDHRDAFGLLRGLLCQSCNSREGGLEWPENKGMRILIDRYRKQPPAQQFVVTRGFTYKYVTAWSGYEHNRDLERRAAS